jgi:5-methylcytosine-specific restriction enzyme subunit McrC
MRIELREHGPAEIVPRMPPEVGRALAPLVRVVDTGTNQSRVIPGVKVGVLRADRVTVQVEPKLDIAHLLFLVDYAARPVGWRDPLVTMGEVKEGLVATVADAFARLAVSVLSRGTLQGYRTVTTTSSVLRGRLRATARFGARPVPFPFPVSYTEFGPDIPENRVLRAAALRARQLPRLRPDTRERLDLVVRTLTGVPDAPAPWNPTRANAPYRGALRLAELILSGSGFGPARGKVVVHGFVLDLDVVFQNFVCTALGQALETRVGGAGGRVRAPYRTHLDVEAEVPISPDFAVLVDGHPAAIADAKYKHGGKRIPADLYQMVVYCSALGLPRGHLVYAAGPSDPVVHEVRHSGVRVYRHFLDLTGSPPQLLAAVDRVAEELAHDMESGTGTPTTLDDRLEEVVHVRAAEAP